MDVKRGSPPAGIPVECLLDSVSDAVIITDACMRVTGWNRAAERAFGWAAGEAAGRHADELLCTRSAQGMERMAETPAAGHDGLELEYTTRDGRTLTMRCVLTQLRDGQGNLMGAVRVIRGITEREQGINRRTELLYEVVGQLLDADASESLIQAICEKVMRFLGCGMFVNYLFTEDRKELRLHACAGVPAERRQEFLRLQPGQAARGSVAKSGRMLVLEDVQHSRDKRALAARSLGARAYACHPLTSGGETIGTLSFGAMDRDAFTPEELALMKAVSGHVSAAIHRMRANENLLRITGELGAKNKLVTDFFTNISHEFKTPLSIILVNLQLMEYRLEGVDGEARERLRKAVTVMRQNSLRLLRLIGNLLDVTKIDAGFMMVRLSRCDAVGLVRNLVESVGDIAAGASLTVRFESNCERKEMPMDAEKMERILLNLLSNAIKHTAPGGSILVRFRGGRRAVTISVKDNGEGIPLEKQESIFDRFHQANTSLTRTSEGCGIGLSLCKALVELLGGRVWFESAPGAGSEFFVELPVLRENADLRLPEIEGMPLNRKLEMEFSDIDRMGKKA